MKMISCSASLKPSLYYFSFSFFDSRRSSLFDLMIFDIVSLCNRLWSGGECLIDFLSKSLITNGSTLRREISFRTNFRLDNNFQN